MSAEIPEMTYLVAYHCPRCKATLQIRAQPAGSWVRCPKCGRASLAPNPLKRKDPDVIGPGEDVLIIGPPPEPRPMTPVAVASGSGPSRKVSRRASRPDFDADPEFVGDEGPMPPPANPFRVAAGAGLCVSVILTIFSSLEAFEWGIVGFSILGVLCLIPLLRIPRV